MLGIIIQARTGSSRLPAKMILDFYKGISLIEVVIDRIKSFGIGGKIILATSVNQQDDILEQIAAKHNILCYRGPENDVIQRFIEAAEYHGCENLIRICADNPLIDKSLLLDVLNNSGKSDYTSFFISDQLPVIKTHYGFFAEYVTVDALKKITAFTQDQLFREHVTNYIYTHPDQFSINRLTVPEFITANPHIRLTIDTATDFMICKNIYAYFYDRAEKMTAWKVIDYLNDKYEYQQLMLKEIENNGK